MGDATPKRIYDGDTSFAHGANSVTDLLHLSEGSFAFSWNMVNRGGALRARPGFDWLYTLPDGELQGFAEFRPRSGFPQQVAVVDGQVYVSDYPYRSFRAVAGARMSSLAKQVYFAQTTKSVERNADGSLRLIQPKNLLMMQDNVNPPAYYDGSVVTAITGENVTPQGGPMVWDGRRLWVAREEQLFASDIADPLSFVEQQFNTLGGLNYYILPGKITALGMTTGVNLPQLLVFTNETTTTFQSNIVDRSLWADTADFQRLIFPDIGCVSQRSYVARAGKASWFSQFGWTTIDAAALTTDSDEMKLLDAAMMRSKSRLSGDLSRIAAAVHENFLMVSVPHASLYNAHTWVHDASPEPSVEMQSWCSVWTGVQPVQWTRTKLGGSTRVFFASKDKSGKNRIYEAFKEMGRDNGVDIPWAVELRPYTGKTIEPKNFGWGELFLSDISGQLDLRVNWAGATRGRWKKCLVTNFKAGRGNIDAKTTYLSSDFLFAMKSQSRRPRTEEVLNHQQDELSSCNIELEDIELTDTAFQLRIEGSGPVSIHTVRVALDVIPDPPARPVSQGETSETFVRYDGAAAKDMSKLNVAPETYTGSSSAEARYKNFVANATASSISRISQSDADKRAAQIARARAERQLRDIAPKYVGSALAPSV
jgi:hypothetical protein